MEQTEILKRLEEQERRLAEIYVSTEKTRKYFLWTLIATLVMFFLPLVGLLFVIPTFISTYSSLMGGL